MDFTNNIMTAIRSYNLSRDSLTFRHKKHKRSSMVRRTGSCKGTGTQFVLGELINYFIH